MVLQFSKEGHMVMKVQYVLCFDSPMRMIERCDEVVFLLEFLHLISNSSKLSIVRLASELSF